VQIEFDDALAVIPYTIGSTGLTGDAHMAYSADDTGTSLYVQLTITEYDAAQQFIRERGEDPEMLVEFGRRSRRRR
jgi:hypothetical protein